MEITYKDNDLKRCAEEPGFARRHLGVVQAKLFLRRISMLLAAVCFEDLRHSPGHFHELRHDRKGQWGWDLNGPCRLVITPASLPIPTNATGGYEWRAIRGAVVLEIVDYHKEGGD